MKSAKRRSHVLGISLEEHGCSAALLERTSAGVRVVKATSFRMSLDVLKDGPDLVGAELQRHLAAARLTEKTCVAVAPTNWLLTAQTVIPEMDAQDVAGYLELQAERLIPVAPSELHLRHAMFRTVDGSAQPVRGATLLALPLNRADRLLAALRCAQLHPVGLTCSAAALANAHGESAAVLHVKRRRADFAIAAGGGLVAVRTLRDQEESPSNTSYDELAREIRISLRRLPAPLADEVQELTVYGDPAHTEGLVRDLAAHLDDLGLSVRPAEHIPGNGIALDSGEAAHADPAVIVAAMQGLEGLRPDPDFLTVKPSRAQAFVRVVMERRAVSIAAVVAAAALIVGGLLFYQHHTLRRLSAEEAALLPQAEAVGALQDRVRRYRPWCDQAAPTLVVVQALTEAFPETGEVWLRTLRVRDGEEVTCTGGARANSAFLGVLDALGSTPGVTGLKVSQLRGEGQLDFSFSYTWEASAQ